MGMVVARYLGTPAPPSAGVLFSSSLPVEVASVQRATGDAMGQVRDPAVCDCGADQLVVGSGDDGGEHGAPAAAEQTRRAFRSRHARGNCLCGAALDRRSRRELDADERVGGGGVSRGPIKVFPEEVRTHLAPSQ